MDACLLLSIYESYPLCSSQGLCSCNDYLSFFLNFLHSFPSAYKQESIAFLLKTKFLDTSFYSMSNFPVLPFIGNSLNNCYDSLSSFPQLSISPKTSPIKIVSPPFHWNGFVQGNRSKAMGQFSDLLLPDLSAALGMGCYPSF